jgi:hypothetical protein
MGLANFTLLPLKGACIILLFFLLDVGPMLTTANRLRSAPPTPLGRYECRSIILIIVSRFCSRKSSRVFNRTQQQSSTKTYLL